MLYSGDMNLPKKTVVATEIKNRFGEYLGMVVEGEEPLAIERHGKPVAVVVNIDQWKKLKVVREKSTPWFDALKEMVERIDRNHPDAKPFSAVDLIDRIRDEEER